MPSALLPATLDDALPLARIARLAFDGSSPISRAMFSLTDPIASDERMARRIAKGIAKGEKAGKAVFKVVESDGQVVGFADWDLPRDGPHAEEEEMEPWLEGTNVDLTKEFFDEMDRRGKLVVQPHYHLHILTTLPGYERRGIGSQSLRWGMERAEKDGRAIYLDATAVGAPLYLRLGFVHHGDEFKVGPNREFEVFPMVYRPRNFIE